MKVEQNFEPSRLLHEQNQGTEGKENKQKAALSSRRTFICLLNSLLFRTWSKPPILTPGETSFQKCCRHKSEAGSKTRHNANTPQS
jgi:hypothetical protein